MIFARQHLRLVEAVVAGRLVRCQRQVQPPLRQRRMSGARSQRHQAMQPCVRATCEMLSDVFLHTDVEMLRQRGMPCFGTKCHRAVQPCRK